MAANEWKIYHQLGKDPVMGLWEEYKREKDRKRRLDLMNRLTVHLLAFSQEKGRLFAFKDYVAYRVLQDENLLTASAQMGKALDPAIFALALADVGKMRVMVNTDWEKSACRNAAYLNNVYQQEQTLPFLEKNTLELCRWLMDYHKENGTGIFAEHCVFKLSSQGKLMPIEHYDRVSFADLIGYERQIQEIRSNVENFLKGQGFNNMLLYGDRGTGKSSSVKALLQEYRKDGLCVIEMKKDQFTHFPSVANALRGRRQKCMVFIDDLSFEPDETSYKELKAVLEGSFESKPDNLMMVVTSNRRHLIKESFADRESDIHVRETVGEQLSLFDRFGLIIYYQQPDEALFRTMVVELAKRKGIPQSEEKILLLANQWKAGKGTKSGRSAQQFIESLRTTE